MKMTTDDMTGDTNRVLAYIREHPFCEFDEIEANLGLHFRDTLYDIIHDLEARYLIGVKRLRPHYKFYPI